MECLVYIVDVMLMYVLCGTAHSREREARGEWRARERERERENNNCNFLHAYKVSFVCFFAKGIETCIIMNMPRCSSGLS